MFFKMDGRLEVGNILSAVVFVVSGDVVFVVVVDFCVVFCWQILL